MNSNLIDLSTLLDVDSLLSQYNPGPTEQNLSVLNDFLETLILSENIVICPFFFEKTDLINNPTLQFLVNNKIVSYIYPSNSELNNLRHIIIQKLNSNNFGTEIQNAWKFTSDKGWEKVSLRRIFGYNIPFEKESIEQLLGYIPRGIFYNEFAKMRRINYIPHLWRAKIFLPEIIAEKRGNNYRNLGIDYSKNIRTSIAEKINDEFDKNIFEINFPFLLGAFLPEIKSKDEILPLALKIRSMPEAKAFRKWATNLNGEIIRNNGLAAINARNELHSLKKSIEYQLGIEEKEFGVTIAIGQIVQVTFNFPVPKQVQKIMSIFNRRHIIFLKDIINKSLLRTDYKSDIENIFPEHQF